MIPDGSILYADGARGQYIPQHFAESVVRETVTGLNDEHWKDLEAGPEHEWYWESWNDVLNRAEITHPDTGEVYTLYQDDDLWLVPINAEWDDDEN